MPSGWRAGSVGGVCGQCAGLVRPVRALVVVPRARVRAALIAVAVVR